jgi:CYTH domain-containing protein
VRPGDYRPYVDDDPSNWRRLPGQGKYARDEIERRFLIRGEVDTLDDGRLIEDRYLDGLRLRLRRVTKDGESIFKLTQKIRGDESNPAWVSVTNVYLSVEEYERLSALPGCDLVKTRRVVVGGPAAFVVDEFHGRLRGLRLAEVEVVSLSSPLRLPEWVGAEITSDDRFSGGRLARADAQEVRELR